MGKNRRDYYAFPPNSVHMSVCLYCKHKTEGATCAAFPDGIPEDILNQDNDHTEPVEGDNGIQFEPRFKDSTPVRTSTKIPGIDD